MKKEAEELNNILKETQVYSMLSRFGKRMHIPHGFPEQSRQAEGHCNTFDATAGVAREHGKLLYLNTLRSSFSNKINSEKIFDYAPMAGYNFFREAWKKEMLKKNPSLEGKSFSLPMVTGGITHSINVAMSLFADENDKVIIPNYYWENYSFIIQDAFDCKMETFELFSNNSFNIKGLYNVINSSEESKLVLIINFPNNPTGYTPTIYEADELCKLLLQSAQSGKKLVIVCDDAYFGLFYEDNIIKESLFSKLCNLHENIMAVKCDGPTKEELSWGFRVAFITFGCKGLEEKHYKALMHKACGVIRSSVSSCNAVSQYLLTQILSDENAMKEKEEAFQKMKNHYLATKAALKKFRDNKSLTPLPFNSGYFLTFETKCNAEELRLKLLNSYQAGLLRIDDHHIRFAFCSVDPDKTEEAISLIYKVATELNTDQN